MAKKKTQDQFIAECTLKHAGKYAYGRTKYTGSKDRITVSCKEHGDFDQIANHHLNGRGCKKCAYERLPQNQAMSFTDFVARSN